MFIRSLSSAADIYVAYALGRLYYFITITPLMTLPLWLYGSYKVNQVNKNITYNFSV